MASTLKMKSPDGTTSVSLGGQNYEANKKGIIDVPAEFEDTMYSFGFITVGKNIPIEAEEPAPPGPTAEQAQSNAPETSKDPEAAKVEAPAEPEIK